MRRLRRRLSARRPCRPVLACRDAEALPEAAAEVGGVVEPVAEGDRGDAVSGPGRIEQVAMAGLQAPVPDVARERHGLNQAQPPLRTDLVVAPRLEDAQLNMI